MNKMNEIVVYISKEKLKGTSDNIHYKDVLESLLHEGVLKSYESVVKLVFDKNKANHIQSVLEFYDVREVPLGPSKQFKKE